MSDFKCGIGRSRGKRRSAVSESSKAISKGILGAPPLHTSPGPDLSPVPTRKASLTIQAPLNNSLPE